MYKSWFNLYAILYIRLVIIDSNRFDGTIPFVNQIVSIVIRYSPLFSNTRIKYRFDLPDNLLLGNFQSFPQCV